MAKEEIKYALTKGQQLHYIPNSLEKLQGKKECIYTIEKVLGQGGYGITYLASTKIEQGRTKHKIFYAIKEFFPQRDCTRDEGSSLMKLPEADMAKNDVLTWLDEFEQEAKQLNNICNKIPHVVKVNEVFRENNTAYYVMEYLDGGSVKDAIDKNGFSEQKALGIIIPIAKTVARLHEHRIIHCDIKDGNIMMNKKDDGSLDPILIDFGESRHLNADGSLTSKRVFAGGTPGFAPEEQLAGIITEQVDVYALAATLFKMLTGTNPQVQSSMTEEYIERKLPENISEQTRKAIKHALKHRREERTGSVKHFVEELEGFTPNELPEGFIVAHGTENYQIISVQETTSYYIRYKVNVTRSVQDTHDGLTRLRVIYGRDLYEFFDINNHKRNNDNSLLSIGDTSVSEQHFLDICKKITKGEISDQFHESSNLGWVSFASNNTFYLVDTHYRKPLPWKRILSYGGLGLCGTLFVIGTINIYNGIQKEKWEMSQRLTTAIITNNADSLRIFAEDDSVRAYLPYAKICFDNGDYTTAKIFAAKAKEASPQDSVAILCLYADIHEKESLLLQQGEMKRKEQAFDSLYNLAKGQYDAKQFLLAKETLNKLDSDFLSRQQVINLLNDINTFINSDEKEEIFNNLLKVAESQYDNNLYIEAKATIEKMDREHRSRREVTVLLNKIESGLKTQELEKQYSDYLSKAQTAYKANPRRLDEALEYLKKIQSMGADYYTRFPVKALMDDIGSKIDPSSILKDAEKKGQWDKVRELALSDYLPACGSLAKHYLKTGDTDAHCRAYYWAKKSSTVDREYVLGMLKSYGFLKDDGTPVVECNNIKY